MYRTKEHDAIEALILAGWLAEANEIAAKIERHYFLSEGVSIDTLVRIKHGKIVSKKDGHYECSAPEFPALKEKFASENLISGITVAENPDARNEPMLYSYKLGKRGSVWFATGCEPVDEPQYVKGKLLEMGFPTWWAEANHQRFVCNRDPFPAFMLNSSLWRD